MKPKLSILIPTLPQRTDYLCKLLKQLQDQIQSNELKGIEIITAMDCKEISIGAKRNQLVEMAHGAYVCFIDDDDSISPDYLQQILKAIEYNPSVITFCGRYFSSGEFVSNFSISGLYKKDEDTHDLQKRKPNHLCPIKREIALACKFPDIGCGEDYAYAKQIAAYQLSEYHIKEKIYDYLFEKNNTETQK